MAQTKKLTKDQVLHIAELANLRLSLKEVTQFQKQLSDVLTYIDILSELDTDKVEPTSQVTGLKNITRSDKSGGCLTQKQALDSAKSKKDGYFRVKAIFND